MNTIKMFHGTNTAASVLNAIIGSGSLRNNFHLTHDKAVARNYGSQVVEIELTRSLTKAHVGLINKESNFNASVGNSVETVLDTPAAINEFFFNLEDAIII